MRGRPASRTDARHCADELDDLFGSLGDDQLRVRGEGHDGVGRRFDRQDQIRVEVKVLFGVRKAM